MASLSLKKIIRPLLLWTSVGIMAFLFMLGLVFEFVQTDMGKRHLARWLSVALSSGPGLQVRLEGIDGFIPFDLHLALLSVRDADGEWLRLKDAHLRWAPGPLLKGRIHIHALKAAFVRLERLPLSQKKEKAKGSDLLFSIPPLPPSIVEHVAIETLSLGKALLGEPAVLRIDGRIRAQDSGENIHGFLKIERMDGARASADLEWSLTGKEPVFSLHGKVEEIEEGLLRTITGWKETGPISIEFYGKGPLNSWKGQIHAKAEKVAVMEAEMGWQLHGDLTKVTVGGEITLLPPFISSGWLSPMGDNKIRFGLDVDHKGGKGLVIHGAAFETKDASLRLKGRFDTNRQEVEGDVHLGVNEISSLGPLMGTRVQGRLSVEGHFSGPLRQPKANLSIHVVEPELSGLRASKVDCEVSIETEGQPLNPFQGAVLRGGGRVEGLSYPRADAFLPAREFYWSFDCQWEAGTPIMIRKLDLSARNLLMTFSGRIDPIMKSFKGTSMLEIKDLRSLSGIIGAEIQGETRLEVLLEGQEWTRPLSAKITGKGRGLGPCPPFLVPLIANGIDYGGHLEWRDSGQLTVSGLRVSSHAASMAGEAAIDFQNKRLSGHGNVELPQMAALAHTTGPRIEGPVDLTWQIRGPFQDPKIMAGATGRGLSIEDISIDHMTVDLFAEGLLAKPKGHFQADLLLEGRSIRGLGNYELDKRRVGLSGLSISSLETEVSGNLKVDTDKLIAEGELQGKCRDLQSLSALFGENIAGRAFFKAVFLKGTRGQDVDLEIEGRDLKTRLGDAAEVGMRGGLKDIFHSLEGKTEIEIKGYHRGDIDLGTMTIQADGQMNRTRFSVNAKGRYRESFELLTGGEWDFFQKGGLLQLDRLQGRFGSYSMSLARPMVIRRVSMEHYVLEGADFQIGEGRFEASGEVDRRAIEMKGRLEGLPLGLLHLMGGPEFLGTASGRVHLSGPLHRPAAEATIQAKGVRLKDASLQNIPPVNLTSLLTLKDDRASFHISVEGLSEKPIKGDFQVPMNISLLPFSFTLNSKGEMEGNVSAQVKLERAASLFNLGDQNLGGILLIDLTCGGSLDSPEIKGRVQISNGAYENISTGTLLKDIQILARVKDKKLSLEEARATDGEAGVLLGQGWIDLLPVKDFPVQLDLLLKNMTLIRRDDMIAATEGKITLAGSFNHPVLSGDLTVGPAEFRIPDRLPPEIVELKVQEINLPGRKTHSVPTPPEKGVSRLRLDLTLGSPGRIFLRGRGLDSEWKGRIRIAGDANEPNIKGVLSVVRGIWNLFGKPFSMKQGTLTFQGNIPPSPDFDVTAEHRRKDMTTLIRLQGTPNAPKIRLESDPPVPSDEILSRLLFGRSAANITPIQALMLAQAVKTLSGGKNLLNFMDVTRKLLRVDQFDIKQMDEKEGGTAVSMGKYLREDVYLEMEKGVGTEGGKISVEIELTPNITVETDAGLNTRGGVGVNWKWDY